MVNTDHFLVEGRHDTLKKAGVFEASASRRPDGARVFPAEGQADFDEGVRHGVEEQ